MPSSPGFATCSGRCPVDELIAFFAARLDEIEQAARAAAGPGWHLEGLTCLVFTRAPDVRGIAWCDNGRDGDAANAAHIAANDPASVLADVAADRALIAILQVAQEFSDQMFASANPEGIASGEVLGHRMRAATQVLTMENVIKVRAARFSAHPQWRPEWRSAWAS